MTISRPHPVRVPAAAHQFVFDPDAEPALHIRSGDTILVETLDCFSGRLTAESPPLRDDRDVLDHIGGRYNPVNRPIFVTDAEPGDVLAVDIIDIALGARQGFGVTHVAEDWAGQFGGEDFAGSVAPATIIARLEGDMVILPLAGGLVTCPARPMIGTIGTAPAQSISSLLYGASHGGNLDCPLIRPGATVHLPVNVPGALLSLGDVHALMGDGEITGTALETSADVTIRVRVEKPHHLSLATPRLSDDERLGSIGCSARGSVQTNIQCAVRDLALSLEQTCGLSAGDALQLFNLFGKITVNQAVGSDADGWSSVLAHIARRDLAHVLSAISPVPASRHS
jgi:amidase